MNIDTSKLSDALYGDGSDRTIDLPSVMYVMLKILPERITYVIFHHLMFGETLDEVGMSMGISGNRVRQLEYKGIRILKNPNYEKYYRDGGIERYIKEREEDSFNKGMMATNSIVEALNNIGCITHTVEIEPVSDEKFSLNTDIKDLNLTVRSFNCLYRKGLRTIGDIVKFDTDGGDIKTLRNLGPRSYDEIILTLKNYGIELINNK